MQLVGAPLAYIRGPFVMEGILQGGIGAVLALFGLWGVFALGRHRLAGGAEGLLDSSSFGFLPWQLCILLVAGGLLVGCAGGWMAARSAR